MKLTRHAQEQMRRRGISPRQIEDALSKGKEIWRRRAFLVMSGALRVIYCPTSDSVITAWWQGRKPSRKGRCRVNNTRGRKR